MKTFPLFLFILLFPSFLVAQVYSPRPYHYLSPLPNSTLVNPEANIIVRPGDPIERASLREKVFRVVGTLSGDHRGSVRLSDDGETVVFRPGDPFAQGETVTVIIGDGIRALNGRSIPPYSFSFTVAQPRRLPKKTGSVGPESDRPVVARLSAQRSSLVQSPTNPTRASLPPDFPSITFTNQGPAVGDPIFLSTLTWGAGGGRAYLVILDRSGAPIFYRKVPEGWDFKVQPSGLLSYYDVSLGYFLGLDSSYHVVDSFMCGNGYYTNEHELKVLPNGHAYLMSYDPQPIAMDTIVEGGNPEALVFGLIIQEIDADKNVVFEWRSWDHFKITDATNEDLTGAEVDYVHGNSIDIDNDGNLILSSRNMDEVTKINRETGEIIWRLGGKNSQFRFVNDPTGFEKQHDARRLPTGNISLFDNGTYREYSRAAEYAISESDSSATLVWEYRPSPDIFGWALGSAQRLPNGNTLIGWGSANPTATEVTSTGAKEFELDLPADVFSYRVYSGPWKSNAFVPAVDTLTFPDIAVGDSASLDLTVANPTGYDLTLTSLSTGTSLFTVVPSETLFLANHGSVLVHVAAKPEAIGTFSDILEIRSEDSTQGIIQRVILRASSPAATISAAPTSLAFGTVPLGTSRDLAVVLSNASVNGLVVDSIYTGSPVFTVNPSHLSIRTSDSAVVTFHATAPGGARDTLYLLSNSTTSLIKVPLSGNAPKGMSLSVTSLEFGSVQPGDSSAQTFAVRNGTASPLTITSARVKSNVFTLAFTLPVNVNGGDSVVLPVRFKPTSVGSFNDTLVVLSNVGRDSLALKGISSWPPVGVARDGDGAPSTFSLSQNYPNPFNPATTITFALPEASTVRLTVYDLIGREVAALVNDQLAPGYYRCTWNASRMPSGVYLYRMVSLSSSAEKQQIFEAVKKLLLVK